MLSALSASASAQTPAKPLAPSAAFNVNAVWPTPHATVTRILNAYIERRQPDFMRLPLVDRLKQALSRTDLAGDFILKGPMTADGKEPELNAFRILEEKIIDAKRREIIVWTLLAKTERRLIFDFDVTSGDWLITDIRDGRGSLRQDLQIPPPVLTPRP